MIRGFPCAMAGRRTMGTSTRRRDRWGARTSGHSVRSDPTCCRLSHGRSCCSSSLLLRCSSRYRVWCASHQFPSRTATHVQLVDDEGPRRTTLVLPVGVSTEQRWRRASARSHTVHRCGVQVLRPWSFESSRSRLPHGTSLRPAVAVTSEVVACRPRGTQPPATQSPAARE